MFLNIQYLYLLNKYIKCNFRGQRCGTTPIRVVRRQSVNSDASQFRRSSDSKCTISFLKIANSRLRLLKSPPTAPMLLSRRRYSVPIEIPSVVQSRTNTCSLWKLLQDSLQICAISWDSSFYTVHTDKLYVLCWSWNANLQKALIHTGAILVHINCTHYLRYSLFRCRQH